MRRERRGTRQAGMYDVESLELHWIVSVEASVIAWRLALAKRIRHCSDNEKASLSLA